MGDPRFATLLKGENRYPLIVLIHICMSFAVDILNNLGMRERERNYEEEKTLEKKGRENRNGGGGEITREKDRERVREKT